MRTQSQFWLFLLAIWVLSFLVLLPATQSPWHGLEHEQLSASIASLRTLDLWTIGKMAPGQSLGWWSLLEQRRFFADPLTFRLVNLFLVSALVLFFGLALAGENLRELETRPDALFTILPALALFAFHPYLSDLVANAFCRPVLLAGFCGMISFLLCRRALAEKAERPGSLAGGVLFFLFALACHPAAVAVLAPLVGPFLLRSRPIPRNWIILLWLALVAVVYFGLGVVWAQAPLRFFHAEFFSGIPLQFHLQTIASTWFPVPVWSRTLFYALLACLLGLAPVYEFRKLFWTDFRTTWAWRFVYLLGMLGFVVSLQDLPGIYLAGPMLLASAVYVLIPRLRESAIHPGRVTRVAVLGCSFAAMCFLFLAATRSQSYSQDPKRARAQVENFPAWPAAWRDYGLSVVGDHRSNAGWAVLTRTAARFPEDLPTKLAMMEVALDQNRLDQAKTILDQLQTEAPDRWEVVFYLCALAARQGNLAEAEGYCPAVTDERPDSAAALNYLATVRLQAGRLADASNLLDQARQREPRNASVLNNLGYLAEQKQDLDRAFRYYQQAAALEPTQGLYLKNLAHLHYLRQQIPEAIANLEAAVRANPRDLQARANLARLLIEIQDRRRGEEQALVVIRAAPDSPEALEMRQLLYQLGRTPPPLSRHGSRLR